MGEIGWCSPHSQFSPPLIKYEIPDMKKPRFAICNPKATADREDRGEIFNPLKEEKHGVANPYAEPERGLIRDFTDTDVQTQSSALH